MIEWEEMELEMGTGEFEAFNGKIFGVRTRKSKAFDCLEKLERVDIFEKSSIEDGISFPASNVMLRNVPV